MIQLEAGTLKNQNNSAAIVNPQNKGIINLGVNPSPKPLPSNPKSAVSRLEEDPIIDNKANLSPNMKPTNLNNINQGFNNGGNMNMNMRPSGLTMTSSQLKWL